MRKCIPRIGILCAGLVLAATVGLPAGLSAQEPAASTASAVAPSASEAPAGATDSRQLLNRYCVTCHNDRLETAGLSLQEIDTLHVAEGAETWEKVIQKLRTGTMPPSNRPQPPVEARQAMREWLETSLDAVWETNPNPGRTETLRRLKPHGISELDPRPARAGHRCHGAAPSGRERVRLRQRDGRQPLAGAARPLHLRGAQDQPAGRWRAAGVRRERRDPRAPGHHAGSARAGAADRHPGRRGRVAHLPAGRTVRHSGAPRPQSQRQHRRPARSAVARAAVPAGPDADSELHDRAAGR